MGRSDLAHGFGDSRQRALNIGRILSELVDRSCSPQKFEGGGHEPDVFSGRFFSLRPASGLHRSNTKPKLSIQVLLPGSFARFSRIRSSSHAEEIFAHRVSDRRRHPSRNGRNGTDGRGHGMSQRRGLRHWVPMQLHANRLRDGRKCREFWDWHRGWRPLPGNGRHQLRFGRHSSGSRGRRGFFFGSGRWRRGAHEPTAHDEYHGRLRAQANRLHQRGGLSERRFRLRDGGSRAGFCLSAEREVLGANTTDRQHRDLRGQAACVRKRR